MKFGLRLEIDRSMEQIFYLTNNHVADWSTVVVEDGFLKKKTMAGNDFLRID